MKRFFSQLGCLLIAAALLLGAPGLGLIPAVTAAGTGAALPGTLELELSTGAGAWYTDITIDPDGTFTGSYQDTDFDDVYYSNFSGRFTNINQIDAYTYTMRLGSIEFEEPIGTESYEGETHFVVSYPNGIPEAGDTVWLYLPGHDTASLSEDMLLYLWRDGVFPQTLDSCCLSCTFDYDFGSYTVAFTGSMVPSGSGSSSGENPSTGYGGENSSGGMAKTMLVTLGSYDRNKIEYLGLEDLDQDGDPEMIMAYNGTLYLFHWAGSGLQTEILGDGMASIYCYVQDAKTGERGVAALGNTDSSTFFCGYVSHSVRVAQDQRGAGCYRIDDNLQYEEISKSEYDAVLAQNIILGELFEFGDPNHYDEVCDELTRMAQEEEASTPSYTYPLLDAASSLYQKIADVLGGQIAALYRLTDDLYYAVLKNDGSDTGALVKGSRVNGQETWTVLQRDDPPLSQKELDALAVENHQNANMGLDFGKVTDFTSPGDIVDYLKDRLDNMDGLSPNDAAKSDLASFIESAISGLSAGSVTGGNQLTADSSLLSALTALARSAQAEVEALLRDRDVTLNKDLEVVIRVLWQDLDWGQACQLTLDSSLGEALDGFDVRFLLADGQHYIQLSAQRLKVLLGQYGTLFIQMVRGDDDIYTVNFLDRDGEIISQLSDPVTIGLPASSLTSTIMVMYAGGSDNWGGQYDEATGVISFDARYSGQYQVLENAVQIDDIGGLDEETQTAIRFLVSKGFLTLDGNNFNPSGSLTRYQFTQALVGMFFALDRDLTTTFTDVPADSEFYPYVASAQARDIVEGIDETTFGGEWNMTVEQMLTVAGRTLVDQKGYLLPDGPESYLDSFDDRTAVSGWALQYTALSVREGIQDRGGELRPQAEITRAQAAVVLYRLFLRLYEVSPVALNLPPAAEEPPAPEQEPTDETTGPNSFPVIPVVIGAAVVAAAGGGIAAAIALTRKKKQAAVTAPEAAEREVLPPEMAEPEAPVPEMAEPEPPTQENTPPPETPDASPSAPQAQHRTFKFCPKCGAPLSGPVKFCPKCGNRLD